MTAERANVIDAAPLPGINVALLHPRRVANVEGVDPVIVRLCASASSCLPTHAGQEHRRVCREGDGANGGSMGCVRQRSRLDEHTYPEKTG